MEWGCRVDRVGQDDLRDPNGHPDRVHQPDRVGSRYSLDDVAGKGTPVCRVGRQSRGYQVDQVFQVGRVYRAGQVDRGGLKMFRDFNVWVGIIGLVGHSKINFRVTLKSGSDSEFGIGRTP